MKITQLSLFEKVPEPQPDPSKTRYYKDLSIHEKINVKCNSFIPHVHLLNARQGFNKTFPILRDDHPEKIQWEKFHWNMMHNHGGVIRITKKEIREGRERKEKFKNLMYR
jgi:hypothetical protein